MPQKNVKPPKEKPIVAAVSSEPMWHVRTDDGKEYGPVTHLELQEWLADGRLDSECQLLQEGWDQWCWADEQFPVLAASEPPQLAEENNPFAGLEQEQPVAIDNPFVAADPAVSENPFASPRATSNVTHGITPDTGSVVTPGIKSALAQTRPWVVFLSIVGFLLGSLLVLVSLFFMATLRVGMLGVSVGLLYLGMAALYLFASYYLYTYGRRIADFLGSNSVRHLQAALIAQKSFWKLMGTVVAVTLVLQLLSFALFSSMASALARLAP